MFGDRLRLLRMNRGITQEELASALGVSRSTIGMYETGSREPGFETSEAIADIFNVDMDYLMGRSLVDRKHPVASCTLLYLAGVDVLTARDQMGHSDISVTLGIYTHLDKFFKARKMHKLDDFLSGSTDASQMQVSDVNKMA